MYFTTYHMLPALYNLDRGLKTWPTDMDSY
jgi:hypothetical protein